MRDTMNHSVCDREKIILRSVSENHFDEDALSHIEACANCRETLRVARCLRMLAMESASDETPALPAAGLVLWKARLIEKQLVAARATQSISITQAIASAVAVVTLLGWFWWRWHSIAERLAGLKNEWQSFLTPASLVAIPLFLALCFFLICLAMIFTFRALLKNDFKKGAY